jgi:hypothetical protein
MTQNESILKHLQSGKEITALEALSLYGCFRLASRINQLKANDNPHNIQSRTIDLSNGKKVSQYFIPVVEPEQKSIFD